VGRGIDQLANLALAISDHPMREVTARYDTYQLSIVKYRQVSDPAIINDADSLFDRRRGIYVYGIRRHHLGYFCIDRIDARTEDFCQRVPLGEYALESMIVVSGFTQLTGRRISRSILDSGSCFLFLLVFKTTKPITQAAKINST
jgi:hypothetical protein